MGAPLSQRAFAELLGVSNVAVNRAIKKGRLKAGVDADGKITDPEAARAEYLATLDLTRAPAYVHERAAAMHRGEVPAAPERDPSHGGRPPKAHAHEPPRGEGAGEVLPSMAEASAREKHYRALLAQQKYETEAGELVPVVEVRGKLEAVFRSCRTRLLGVPTRVRQQDPTLTPAQVSLVEACVREALEELASDGAQ